MKQLLIGEQVIIRTCHAGVWYGTLTEKKRDEVILSGARRMYQWWAAESISLSAVAVFGIKPEQSKICGAVPYVWLQAIEILPCSKIAIDLLDGAEIVQAQ